MSRARRSQRLRSTSGVRSATVERGLVAAVGVMGLVAGGTALLVGRGLFGAFRAQRPIADPLALEWLRTHPTAAISAAIALGVLLLALGIGGLLVALRPQQHPDLTFVDDNHDRLVVTSAAIAEAVRSDAERIPGVHRVRAMLVGERRRPTLRLVVALREGTDVRGVWSDLEHRVLVRARDSLGLTTLASVVHLELDTARASRVR
ncbi:hypothetical protein [Actinoalloteichus hymeniacidonis]|uniref:Alkaline shock response membrane anchor protein AmaP n=1 Tax=Actinoalloteichus hymeniacidonis TaxID=340345 RepID=A0AAC9MZV7_9PSEU|nr:hypothetical protein [Actinoalloteichus hymeniacidonis]AOS64889.1 hypothetical protein TL08_20490 [Actinoalloteichus hymeniacidonis]MBB5907036.1 hypothetical protein [Actinoalloteichus hymeniacidonis]